MIGLEQSTIGGMQPVWGQRFGAVVMDLSVHEQPRKTVRCARISSWGRPSGLRPGFRPARSFPVTSGRFFNGAAELPLGAELYVNPRSIGDLIAGFHTNRRRN
jgi:hypothetical protein